jgi:hypothetical protein
MAARANIKISGVRVEQEELGLSAAQREKYTHLMPEKLEETIYLTLERPSVHAIANALRRSCLLVGGKALDCDLGSITTDNAHTIKEVLKRTLNAIPIDQSIPDNARFKLEVANTTSEPLDVMSGDIIGAYSKAFSSQYKLTILEAFKAVTINDIRVIAGSTARTDQTVGFRFSQCAGFTYELDYKNREAPGWNGPKSTADPLIETPTKCSMSIASHGNMPAGEIVRLATNELLLRVERFANVINGVISDDDYRSSEVGGMAVYEIPEGTTVGLMVESYVYDADNTVPLVAFRVRPEDDDRGELCIRHADPTKILVMALDAAQTDLKAIVAAVAPHAATKRGGCDIIDEFDEVDDDVLIDE